MVFEHAGEEGRSAGATRFVFSVRRLLCQMIVSDDDRTDKEEGRVVLPSVHSHDYLMVLFAPFARSTANINSHLPSTKDIKEVALRLRVASMSLLASQSCLPGRILAIFKMLTY